MLDFGILDAMNDSADALPDARHHQKDNQVIFKPEKEDSSSNQAKEEERKNIRYSMQAVKKKKPRMPTLFPHTRIKVGSTIMTASSVSMAKPARFV